jgi:hypothetical protein
MEIKRYEVYHVLIDGVHRCNYLWCKQYSWPHLLVMTLYSAIMFFIRLQQNTVTVDRYLSCINLYTLLHCFGSSETSSGRFVYKCILVVDL